MEYSPIPGPYTAPSTSFHSLHGIADLHSTFQNDICTVTNTRAAASWNEFASGLVESHRWLETYLANAQATATARGKGQRLAVTELMKTPGRSRVLESSTKTLTGSRKDPVATFLFPAPPSRNSPIVSRLDKENAPKPSLLPKSPSRGPFSPASKGKGKASPSPIRASPIRPSPRSARATSPFKRAQSVEDETEMELARIAALLEADLAIGGGEDDIERLERDTEAEGLGDEERTANLSIIGEEEEEEDTANQALKTNEGPLATNSSFVIPETQFPTTTNALPSSSEEAPPTPAKDVLPLPSAAVEETAVPLNDNPSTLRNIFSTSLPASANGSNRTPGGTSNRFTPSAYSAAKTSGVMSSSPPQAPNAPSSFSGFGRPSTGKLIFAPLPNRSLGMGPSLGRSVGSWTAGESQGSQTSISTTSAVTQPISTGGTKRPSMSGADVPNKTSRKTMDSVANESAPKSVLESLNGRLHALQNRSSTVPRASIFPVSTTIKAAITLAPAPVAVPEPTTTLPIPFESPAVKTPSTVAPAVTRLPSPKPFAIAATPIVTGFKPTLSTSSKPLPQAPEAVALVPVPTLRRQNSVTNLVAALESKHDTRVPSPVKGYIASPRSTRTVTNYSTSQIARPISPSPITSPRMMLRSPSLRNENLSRVAAKGSPLVTSFRSMAPTKEEELEVGATTTPKGSPVKPTAGARSIFQKLIDSESERGTSEDKADEEEDQEQVMLQHQIETLRYEVESKSRQEQRDKEERQREEERQAGESRLPSLPLLPVEQGDQEEEDNSDNESMEVAGRLIVEQGRGVMASAIDSGFRPVKKEEPRVIQVATVEKVTKVSPSKMVMPGTLFGMEDEDEYAEGDASVEIMEVTQKAIAATHTLVKKSSQISLAGSTTSNSSSSFFNKGAPKVKSIQLAAAAAKREQQEKERKAAAKEERRLASVQVKQDEERKFKIEAERRRREANELANSQGASKAKLIRPKIHAQTKLQSDRNPEEDHGGKRQKVTSEVKRPEVKKPLVSSIRTGPSNILHNSLNTSTGRSGLAPHHSKAGPSSSMVGQTYMARPPTTAASKTSAYGHPVASTSQAHAAPRPRPTQPRSEPEVYQELPDIDSEYSDSGDENHEAKEAIVPGWAKGDELEDHLYRQKGINPDSIFDAIQPVQMSEIFPANQSRLHKRTSSAVWAGTDALTQADEAIYNQQMGFAPRPRPSTFRR